MRIEMNLRYVGGELADRDVSLGNQMTVLRALDLVQEKLKLREKELTEHISKASITFSGDRRSIMADAEIVVMVATEIGSRTAKVVMCSAMVCDISNRSYHEPLAENIHQAVAKAAGRDDAKKSSVAVEALLVDA